MPRFGLPLKVVMKYIKRAVFLFALISLIVVIYNLETPMFLRNQLKTPQIFQITKLITPTALTSTRNLSISTKREIDNKTKHTNNTMTENINKKWNPDLSREALHILRDKGTEAPNTGAYLHNTRDGIYSCANCLAPVYDSKTKFDSGCGWPAFYKEIPGALKHTTDLSHGMKRVEITCAKCGGHMGHVFEGEGFHKMLGLPTDERHCVNSASLKFKPRED